MSFIRELKRRNVVRVGIAYLVGSWLLIQVADIVFETIGSPAWVMQTLLAILAIGLPVALFLAWAFELTPEGVKLEKDVDRSRSIAPQTGKKLNNTIFILMALAIAYLLYDKFSAPAQPGSDHFSQQSSGQTTNTNETSALTSVEAIANAEAEEEPAITKQSIAVLPFDNRSNREEDQFFTDGIHDDLLTTIARIGSMKVISRTSVMEYRDTTKKIPEIAKELGVANILEGGIQRSGEQVRINVQLIDAQTDEHLWAEIFDRELTAQNLFAIQSEISQKIADALHTTLSPEETERINTMPTQNLDAYNAYMRGKQLLATRAAANIEESIKEFQKAVDLDPQFALAWVGLADSTFLLGFYGSVDNKKALAVRELATANALKIDPGLGEAYVSLANIHYDLREYDQMDSAFRKAIELSPNYATAYHFYSSRLGGISLTQESVDLMRKAAELDPRSGIIGANLADVYAQQGSYSRAEHQYKKVIGLNPNFPRGYQSLSAFYGFYLGRFDLAIQNAKIALTMDPGSVNDLSNLVMFSIDIGDQEAARHYRQKLADISDQDWRLGWSDIMINQANNNAGGVREAWNWMKSRFPISVDILSRVAPYVVANFDPIQAKEIFMEAESGWANPEAWERLIDRDLSIACLAAWTLIQTGDEAIGTALLDQTMAFIATLPGLIEHDDVYGSQICYLTVGDTEKALNHIETRLAHNHLGWWKVTDQLPMYEQIRHEPRYQAAMTELERRLAIQREAVDKTDTETGL